MKRRFDLEFEGIESVWLEFNFPRSSPILVCFVYRAPLEPTCISYLTLLEDMISRANSQVNAKSIVTGDLNFYLLDSPRPYSTKSFFSIFKSFGYEQLITKATRPISNSHLDHLFVSHTDFVVQPGTLQLCTSDHLPVYVCWKFRSGYCRPFGHKRFSFRSHKKFCVDSFVHDLSLLPWNTI